MGWGTEFNFNIYLNRMIFQNRYQVEDKIKDLNDYIINCQIQLVALGTCTPKDLFPESEDILSDIEFKINDLMNVILENQRNITLLELYLEYIEQNPNTFNKE